MARQATRRELFGALAGAAAAPFVVPASALGQGRPAPSDRIGLGHIGVGGMGSGHLGGMLGRGDCQVLAVCDPFRAKRENAKQRAEKAYAQRTAAGTFKGCMATPDFREVVARDDIDAVFIASPEHWHVLHALAAVRAGKDAYVEKALGACIAQTQALVRDCHRYGRVLQVGTQQRSGGAFRQACELARNGCLGKLHTIKVGDPAGHQGPAIRSEPVPPDLDYELWLGPAPWRPYFADRVVNLRGWMLTYDYTIGFMSGWGQHDVDIAQWGNGSDDTGPLEIEGRGLIPAEGLNDTAIHWHTEYTYANGVRLLFASTNEIPYGIRFEGDRGWVHVDRSRITAEPASLLAIQLGPADVRLERSGSHSGNFIECVRTRRPPICNVDVGHHTYVVCALSDIAIRLGRKLRWDPVRETFPGDPEANRMLTRPLRAPWTL
ncbi:MAG TPA: Gfo/Idh/MocA family oxidoreductase [Planctomycetota bacterium]|nr:Gfo/Idh/MocA family oxidoreductase [Planctomycetota bacterium]